MTTMATRKAQTGGGPEQGKAKVLRRGHRHALGPKLPLRALREAAGRTQVDVADAMRAAQGDISRLEQREDVKLSTLLRYVEALGGELDIVVTMPATGHRFRVELPT
jgi:hypothetical protein